MRVSIIINTLNRANSLDTVLQSMRYIDYPNYEVIVVNGPSTDNTEKIIQKYSNYIKVAYCPEKNLSLSRNIGIALAQGDIVAFLDDDAIPEPEWLTHIVKGYDSAEVAGVGGSLYNNTGYYFQVKYSIADRIEGNKDVMTLPNPALCFPGAFEFVSMVGANSSFRRSLLLQVGGFDEQYEYYMDETDVCVRLIDAGYIIKNVENSYVHHKFAPSNVRKPRAFTNFYPIIKNLIYYIHKNYFPFYDNTQLVFNKINHFLNLKKNETTWNYEHNRLSAEEYKSAIESLYTGLNQGFLDANHQERKLIKLETLNSYQMPFKQYPTQTERLVICLVTRGFPPYDYGGIARFNHILAYRLAHLGHFVHVIHHSFTGDNTVDFKEGYWVHAIVRNNADDIEEPENCVLPPNYWQAAMIGFQEVQRIRQHHGRIDIVQAPIWDCEGLPFLLDADYKNKLVTSLHTTFAIEKTIYKTWENCNDMSQFVNKMIEAEKYVIENSMHLYANSRSIIDTIEDLYSIKLLPNRYEIIPHGAFNVEFPIVEKNNNYIDILFVGRLQTRKGINTLLAVIPDILRKYHNVRFFIIGEDTFLNENGNLYKTEFLNLHQSAAFLNRVFFTGKVADDKLIEYYAACAIFVAPSLFESFGLIFLEAMRFSKPVIGCRVGGIGEVVADGINGFLVPPGNQESLKQALFSLIDNEKLREQFGQASRKIFEEKFTGWKMGMASLNFYKKITKKNDLLS